MNILKNILNILDGDSLSISILYVLLHLIKIVMIFIFFISLFLWNFQFTCTPRSFLFCFSLVYIQFNIFFLFFIKSYLNQLMELYNWFKIIHFDRYIMTTVWGQYLNRTQPL